MVLLVYLLHYHRFKKNNEDVVACNFALGELCESYKCKYSFCIKHKMSADGRCLLDFIPNKTYKKEDEHKELEERPNITKSLKFKNKILKKIEDFEDL